MSNSSRVITTDGKSTSGGLKRFGMTLKDRTNTTTPNMTQLTMIPATGTLQKHQFIIGNSITGTNVTPADTNAIFAAGGGAAAQFISIIPDFTLTSGRFYQFTAYLTVIIQPADGTFYMGHYLLSSAAKDTGLIGNGNAGYRLDVICAEDLLDNYFNEMSITLSITSNKFTITVTPTANIIFSIDVLADVCIKSGAFTA